MPNLPKLSRMEGFRPTDPAHDWWLTTYSSSYDRTGKKLPFPKRWFHGVSLFESKDGQTAAITASGSDGLPVWGDFKPITPKRQKMIWDLEAHKPVDWSDRLNPARLPSIPTLRHFILKENMGLPKDLVVSEVPYEQMKQFGIYKITSKSGQSNLDDVANKFKEINCGLCFKKLDEKNILVGSGGRL